MKTITLMHISDLHYTHSKSTDSGIVLKVLREDLHRLSDEGKLKPDLIVFTGDLVLQGDVASDFQAAADRFISPLLETFADGQRPLHPNAGKS